MHVIKRVQKMMTTMDETAESTATVKTPICQALGRGMGLEGCPLSFTDHDACNKARPKNDNNNGRYR